MQIKEKHEIIEGIESAFANCRRPREFVDASHCEECAEHNETLCNADREKIGLKEIGNAGWDPICYVRPEGFLYFFPAMVRLVFDDSTNNEYLSQFLFHCTYEGTESRFFQHFSREQVRATADLMRFLKYNWKKKLDYHLATDNVENAVEIWEQLEHQKA